MNKKGQKSIGLGTILVIAVLVIGVIWYINSTKAPTYDPNQVGGNCYITPSISAVGTDALVLNQNVTPSGYAYVVTNNVYPSGRYVGTSYSPILGDKLDILTSATGYLPDEQIVQSATCDKNPVAFSFKSYENATVTIKQDAKNGASALTNNIAGGAVNATAVTSGGSTSLPVIIEGTTQKSTGKIFMVVELPASSAANVSSVSFNGGTQVSSIPTCLSSNNANAYRVAYEIPAIDGYASNAYNLVITTNAGKTLAGGVYTTYYAEKKFADSTGVIKEGVCDSTNTAQYQDSYSYNFLLA